MTLPKRKSNVLSTLHAVAAPRSRLTVYEPYSTFNADGTPPDTPYVVDGVFPEGTMSLLVAKPKQGKSSLSRDLAVRVSRGEPWLGRDTTRGETILISLEDSRRLIDKSLRAFGWTKDRDAMIHIIVDGCARAQDFIAELARLLKENPGIRFIIVDTMMKFLNISRLEDFMEVMGEVTKLHNLVRSDYPQVAILALAHLNKKANEDTFDSILGSSALRAETNTNIVIYQDGSTRCIKSEVREGVAIPPTQLVAELVKIGGAEVVKSFQLGSLLDELKTTSTETSALNKEWKRANDIYQYVGECGTTDQEDVLDHVGGNRQATIHLIKRMEEEGRIERVRDSRPLAWRLVQTTNVTTDRVEAGEAGNQGEAEPTLIEMTDVPAVEAVRVQEAGEIESVPINVMTLPLLEQADADQVSRVDQAEPVDWEARYRLLDDKQLDRASQDLLYKQLNERSANAMEGRPKESYSLLTQAKTTAMEKVKTERFMKAHPEEASRR